MDTFGRIAYVSGQWRANPNRGEASKTSTPNKQEMIDARLRDARKIFVREQTSQRDSEQITVPSNVPPAPPKVGG